MAGEYTIRSARKDDCPAIAALYSISSEGIADYIWSKLAKPEEDILMVGRRRYEREDSLFSYQNCTVVESDGATVGMLVAFPMYIDSSEKETDPVLAPYSRLEEDNSYYICGIALFPEHRGNGVGTRLLDLAERHAREEGFRKISLIVSEQNRGAMRLYERAGFEEVKREAIYPHPLIHCTGDAILMVQTLA